MAFDTIIGKQIFDIEYDQGKPVHELQDKISFLFNNEVIPAMKNYFDSQNFPDLFFKIESITIDIGNISYEQLDKLLPIRLQQELEKILSDHFYRYNHFFPIGQGNNLQVLETSMRDIETLAYFLEHGTFPWWIQNMSVNDIGNMALSLANTQKDALYNLLIKQAQVLNIRKRISNQFNDLVIRTLISVLEPANADFIIQYHINIISLQQVSQVVKAPAREFTQDVWYFILTQLIVDWESSFNQKQFVKSNLQMIARKYNISYHEILRLFSSSFHIGKLPKWSNDFLITTVIALQQEVDLEDITLLPKLRKGYTSDYLAELLANYLSTGSISLLNSHISVEDLLAKFLQLLRTHPDRLFSFILTFQDIGEVIDRISKMGIREDNLLKSIVKAVAKTEDAIFLHYFSNLEKNLYEFPSLQFGNTDFIKDQLILFISYLGTTVGMVSFQKYIESHSQLMSDYYQMNADQLLPWIKYSAEYVFQSKLVNENDINITFNKEPLKYQNQPEEKNLTKNKQSLKYSKSKKANSAYLLNFWFYYLTTGQNPWWAVKQDLREAELLFAEESLDAKITLLKYAGIDNLYKNRFKSVFPFSFIYDIITHFEIKISYKGLINQTLELILASKRISQNYSKQVNVFIVDSFWSELSDTGYKGITVIGFFKRLVSKLSIILQVDTLSFIGDIQFMLKKNRKNEFDNEIKSAFSLLKLDIKEKENIPIDSQLLTLGFVFSSGFDTDNYFKHTLLQRIKEFFRYYIHYGSMPGKLIELGLKESPVLLKDVVYYLYNHSRHFLVTMGGETFVSTKAIRNILISLSNGKELISNEIIQIFREWDNGIADHLKQVKEIEKSIATYFKKELSKEYIASYLQSSVFRLGDIEIESIRVFAYFKEKGRFPSSLKYSSAALKDRILILAVTALFRRDPRLLEYSLINEQVPERNIRFLHNLFITNTNVSGLQIKSFFEHFLTRILYVDIQKTATLQIEADLDDDLKYYPDVKTAERILRFYILRGFLPSGIPAMPIYAQKLFIKKMIFWLYESNQNDIERILNDLEATENKLDLFDLFAHGLNDRENRFISFLQPFIKTDAEVYLQKQLGFGLEIKVEVEKMLKNERSVDIFIKKVARFSTVGALLIELDTFDKIWMKFAEESVDNRKYVEIANGIMNLFKESRKDLDIQESLIAELKLLFFKNIYQIPSLIQDEMVGDLFYSFIQQINLKLPKGFLVSLKKNITESKIPHFEKKADLWNERLNKLIQKSDIDNNVRDMVIRYADKVYGNSKQDKIPFVMLNSHLPSLLKYDKVNNEDTNWRNKKSIPKDLDKAYIHNAGLVLLAPFFTTYFSKLGLTEAGVFIDEEARHKALHLLQYLVDGKTMHDEQELFLNKILCGMNTQEPVSIGFEIEEKDKEISEELIHVVIKQWEKLNNMSVDGFRNSFLIREGYISLEGDSWKLQVISRGYDVLLQFIPWTYGMIRNSLMDKILYVEWI